MKFKYTAFDKNGKKIKSTIEANDIYEAKEKLKELYILEIKPVKTINISFGRVKKQDLSKLLHTLGLYLKASIPLKKAIKLSKNQTSNPKIIKFLDFIQKEIEEGKSFKSAIEHQKIIKFPEYAIHSIEVAQNSGKLDVILIELSKFLKDEEKISSKTTQAMIYPLFIIFVSFILMIVMLTTVVPKIVSIFKNLNQNLPKITQIVISISNFVKEHYILITVSFLGTVLIFNMLYSKSKKFRYIIDAFFLKLPFFKDIITAKNLGRFSYMSYVLINSGVNYINALNLSTNTISNEKIKSFFQKAMKDVIEGKKLSTSLKKHHFYDKSFIESIALAEETGEVEEIFKNLSEIYLEEYNTKTSTILSLLEPLMMIIVGGIIGTIVAAMLLPIFSMNIGS